MGYRIFICFAVFYPCKKCKTKIIVFIPMQTSIKLRFHHFIKKQKSNHVYFDTVPAKCICHFVKTKNLKYIDHWLTLAKDRNSQLICLFVVVFCVFLGQYSPAELVPCPELRKQGRSNSRNIRKSCKYDRIYFQIYSVCLLPPAVSKSPVIDPVCHFIELLKHKKEL